MRRRCCISARRSAAGGPKMDIAVDPLEGTTLTAKGGPNAHGDAWRWPSMATSCTPRTSTWTRSRSAAGCRRAWSTWTIRSRTICATSRGRRNASVSDLVACMLDRDRHKELIAQMPGGRRAHHADQRRRRGRRDRHGDAGCDIDIYLGSGGAPEGVLAAAALRCVGGQMQGRLMYENEDADRARALHGPRGSERAASRCEEMAKGDVMFAATGVTRGAMLRGVRRFGGGAITHSIVMRSHSGTVRFIEAHHNFAQKTWTATLVERRRLPLTTRAWRGRATACPAGAGCGAPARTGSRLGIAQKLACRRSSAGCWPRAASGSMPRPTSWSRRCGRCCRIRRRMVDMDVAADRLADAVVRRRDGGGVRRLRRRRRVQRGTDGHACCAPWAARCRITCPDRIKEGYGPNGPALLGAGRRGRHA